MQRVRGEKKARETEDGKRERLTPSQMVTWESAGEPVQPAYCSSP